MLTSIFNKKRKLEENNNDNLKKIKLNEDDISINPLDILKQKDEMVYRNQNHIYFREEINFESINKLGKLINAINEEYELLKSSLLTVAIMPKPIYLHLTSEGGILLAGLLGSDMIKNSPIPVYTIVEGGVISAATLLSIVGKKRYMTENSYMLIHQLSSIEMGNYEQLRDSYKNNNEHMKHIINMYMKHTKLTKRQLNSILKHDLYWNFDKAKKNGLVDEIYKPKNIYKTSDE